MRIQMCPVAFRNCFLAEFHPLCMSFLYGIKLHRYSLSIFLFRINPVSSTPYSGYYYYYYSIKFVVNVEP